VRVGEGVHVGRGVRVGVRVHTIGVRLAVGVAESASRKAPIRAVCTADVALAESAKVAVKDGTVAVGGGVCVGTGGDVDVIVTVAAGGRV
jgi:hypothetical protein